MTHHKKAQKHQDEDMPKWSNSNSNLVFCIDRLAKKKRFLQVVNRVQGLRQVLELIFFGWSAYFREGDEAFEGKGCRV